MNYHAKSGASTLKIDKDMLNLIFGGHFVFRWPFCFLVAIFAEGQYELPCKIWSF